jgi:phosphoribosyl 1,2-cyclic phosphodiesterase
MPHVWLMSGNRSGAPRICDKRVGIPLAERPQRFCIEMKVVIMGEQSG